MNLKKIAGMLEGAVPYAKGTHTMWTDDYISGQLLSMYIDESHDIASRSRDKIEKIVSYIATKAAEAPKAILDLGCGPGRYTERLAKLGHRVTGIDFSKKAIAYAKKHAAENGLEITYLCQNYLDIAYENEFDIVTLIYCDFGVLSPEERNRLIEKIFRALKPGGQFVFDALNEKSLAGLVFGRQWEIAENGGFWKETPYICLSENLLFKKENATLAQHLVADEKEGYALYRFWNHYFCAADIETVFRPFGFARTDTLDITLGGGPYNDEGVTFYRVTK